MCAKCYIILSTIIKEKTRDMIFINQLNQSESKWKFTNGFYFYRISYHSISL